MLYFIGLGLSDEKDISVRGLEIVRRASRVYLEAYTAILLVGKEQLEAFYGRSVILADRETVESNSDAILSNAASEDVAFLVVGDPFSATTHTDLLLRAREAAVPTASLPNASILTAIGACGLSLYAFGQTVSLPLFTPTWRPTSFYGKIAENASLGLHTLILLDIKVREPDLEKLARGKVEIVGPRYMTAQEGVGQLLEAEAEAEAVAEAEAEANAKNEGERGRKVVRVCGKEALAVAAARVGGGRGMERFAVGTLAELESVDMGEPLHSLVLIGKRTHALEREVLKEWAVDRENFERIWARDYSALA